MRRIRDTGEMSADIVRKAFDKYSENKHKRKNVRRYESCLDENLDLVLRQLVDESWTPSPYIEKTIIEKKMRRLAKAPIRDHVLEAAAIFPYEKQLYDYIAWQAPAVRPGMGQAALLRMEMSSRGMSLKSRKTKTDSRHS